MIRQTGSETAGVSKLPRNCNILLVTFFTNYGLCGVLYCTLQYPRKPDDTDEGVGHMRWTQDQPPLLPAQAWQTTTSRLTDAHSGFAEPQSPHTLLSGFSHRRSATWLQDRALRIDEDRLSNQTDRSFDESTDRLKETNERTLGLNITSVKDRDRQTHRQWDRQRVGQMWEQTDVMRDTKTGKQLSRQTAVRTER